MPPSAHVVAQLVKWLQVVESVNNPRPLTPQEKAAILGSVARVLAERDGPHVE